MSTRSRPLSPHLGIYRWGWTMSLSILHRASGVALAVGLLGLTAWLVGVARGGADYATLAACMQSLPGRLALMGFVLALCYHLANGIRHLAWDAGFGLAVPVARATGGLVVVASLALAIALMWRVFGGVA